MRSAAGRAAINRKNCGLRLRALRCFKIEKSIIKLVYSIKMPVLEGFIGLYRF